MANNSMLESYEQGEMLLVLDEGCAQLHSKERESALRDALERFYGTPLRLKMRVGQPQEETPAQQRSRLQDAQQQAALDAIYNDPNVKALEQRFNARVTPGSVRPKALSSEDE
jgi:DNA polymerase-3 subunit gamma/tau